MSRKYRQVFEAKRAPVELTEAPEDDDEDGEEDLSMWCAPGQSVEEMLQRAAERDS